MVPHQPADLLRDAAWLVLTGATSAVGQAVAAAWREAGGPVLGVSRMAEGSGCDDWVVGDLRSPWSVADRVRTAVANRPVGALVHAAGLVYADAAVRTTPDEWDQTMAVNLTAAFALARTLAPLLTAPQGVVLVGSIDAHWAPRDGPDAAYGAAKAGLLGLVRHLAVEWGPAGLRVNVVLPGPMTSGMGVSAEMAAARGAGAVDGQWTSPAEVAAAVFFLLTARGITGQALAVDHGWQLGY
jgi:NAD(P)-dependent dehydrogenase (short-subunit alcohol dehydrogenase family)